MQSIFLKSKIHNITVTQADLYYEGSLTIDEELMEQAGLHENEKVAVVNINNGERLETYVIKGQRGSKIISLNGAAARKGLKGDKIIIISYCILDDEEIPNHKPKIFIANENNEIREN